MPMFVSEKQLKFAWCLLRENYMGSRIKFSLQQDFRFNEEDSSTWSTYILTEYLDEKPVGKAYMGNRMEIVDLMGDLESLDPKIEERDCEEGRSFLKKRFIEWKKESGYDEE